MGKDEGNENWIDDSAITTFWPPVHDEALNRKTMRIDRYFEREYHHSINYLAS